jgi:hypothetical protein
MIATGGRGSLWWLLAGALGVGLAISVHGAAAQQSGGAAEANNDSATKRARPPKSNARSSKASDKTAANAASAKLDAAGAQREVEAGINAISAGKSAEAVVHLSAALTAGSLPSAQTARALYYRGVANRKAGNTAAAISDLTSALWLKGGLTPQQRADALDNRSAAYREAGLSDQSSGGATREPAASPIVAPISLTAAAPPAGASNAGAPYTIVKRPPAQQPAQSSGGLGSIFGSVFGGTSGAPEPARSSSSATATSVTTTRTVPAGFESVAEAFGSGGPAPVVSRTPAPIARPAASSWSTTASLQPSAQATGHVEVAPRKAPVVAMSWSKATKVKPVRRPTPSGTSAPKSAAQSSPLAVTAAAAAVRSGAEAHGSYQVQVAAVRSAQEAADVAAQVQQRFARDLGGRAPVVDQTSIGTLGTIYRVQIGPFTSSGETQALCSKLKGAGMDCRIVAAVR